MSSSFNTSSDKPTAERQRPVQAVPVSYTSSWLYFLIIFCLLIAWYFPVKILISYLMWPPVIESEVRNSNVFAALAYERISRREGEISPSLFREHLQALRDHGYSPITLDDVRGLMLRNEPLPPRAVLTTFDHGRRTSYFETRSIMRRAGWRGVMFLWTRPIEDRDMASLLWPYVRSMVRTPTWEIGAQSHRGFDAVKANAAGRTGNFMTTPRWLDAENRFERPEEFTARLQEDHEYQLKLIQRRAGIRPRAYAYPYGDFGQFRARGEFIRRVNLAHVGHFYDLGFVSGNLAVNTRYSDPRRLNRLRVRSEWSGDDLVQFLERAWPKENREMGGGGDQAPAWIVDWGEMDLVDETMSLRAGPQTTGAKMWLAGSDLSRDFYARVNFRLRQGQMGLYVRASPDEESYIYLGLDSRGEAWLREKHHGREQERWDDEREGDLSVWLRQKHVALDRFTLASSQTRMIPRDTHTLEIFVRDQLLYALINGEPLFDTHIKMRGETQPGMFGISVWDPERGQARVDITSVSLRPQQPTLAMWGEQRGYAPHVIQWIHNHAYQLTQISPPWISFSPVGQQVRHTWDHEIIDRLARMYHLDVVPRIRIEQQEWLAHLPPSVLAELVAENGFESIFINMERMGNATPSRVASWLQQTMSALQDQGVAVMVKMPTMLERAATLNSILAVMPTLQVAVTGNSPINSQGNVTVERVPDTPEPDELPIYYQIMDLPEATEARTHQERVRALEEGGLAAFRDGEYERAISRWSEWNEIDPGNPRPLMLLGDAYLRLNQPRNAIRLYDRSLDKDPGQIALAIRRVRIMIQEDMADEAIDALNLYARLFPNNADILLAQAELLHQQNHTAEARRVAERVLTREPHNLDALTLMIRLSETPEERMRFLAQMVRDDISPNAQYELGNTIWRYDLLSIPEAHGLRRLVDRIYRNTTDERVRLLYEKLQLKEHVVHEDFAGGEVSGSWWLYGGDSMPDAGRVRLRTDPGRTEVSLRLLGSERLRDSFVETTVRNWNGSFWLYARRTANQLVRFGFEDDPDRLHLQIWRDGRLVLNNAKDVSVPTDQPLTLRLEMRGDGMMGYYNGTPLFDAAIPIPSDLWLGWTGLAAFDSRVGAARVTIDQLSAGALPLRIALMPEHTTAHDLDTLLEDLRPFTGQLTDLAPRFFTIQPNGEWSSHLGPQHRLIRLFARYHRLRLVPVVEVLSTRDLPVRELLANIREHRLDGATLLFNTMPSDTWFETMRAEMRLHPVDIHVMVKAPEEQVMRSRPLGSAIDLYHGDESTWTLPVLSGTLRDSEFRQIIMDHPRDRAFVLQL